MGSSRPPSLEMDPNFSLEVAGELARAVARYSEEIGEDPLAAFERKVRQVIQWTKDLEGKSFIASFMKVLARSAVEVAGGDYRLEIPREFHLEHGDMLTPTVTFEMRDSKHNNRSWDIELLQTGTKDKVRLFAMGKGGWRAFADANNLKQGDVLFFLLKAKSRFRVVAARCPEWSRPE